MTRFTTDNTEGYTTADLAALNAMFSSRCVAMEIDVDDRDFADGVAERVLADFDSGIA